MEMPNNLGIPSEVRKVYKDVESSTNVINGEEYRNLFCAVANIVSGIVSGTLGPYGATTIIDDGTGFTYPTKDGWSCMSRLRFNDPVYNTIFNIVKQPSFNSATTVGDGTTTAMVATANFLNLLYSVLTPFATNNHYRQADILKSMHKVCMIITDQLRKNPNVKRIDPNGDMIDIYKIASIATNGNSEFAEMLQKIYQETKNPNIRISIDPGAPETTYEIERGYRFDCGIIGFQNYVNAENQTVKCDVPHTVLIFDHNVTFSMHRDIISAASQVAQKNNTSVMLMAPYFDDLVSSGIDSQVTQMTRAGQYPNIMLVQIPMVSKLHQQAIIDLAVLTGAVTMTENSVKAFNTLKHNIIAKQNNQDLWDDSILQLDMYKNFDSPMLLLESFMGKITSATFNSTTGYLMDYDQNANKIKLDAMLRECKQSYEEASIKAAKTINGFLDKDYLFIQNRYIRLMGSNALIKVGGASDIQRRCDKDALDDAILACKSAYQYGYVRGMDLEIIKICDDVIKDPELSDLDCEVAIVIYCSFLNVFETILYNRYGDHFTDEDDAKSVLTFTAPQLNDSDASKSKVTIKNDESRAVQIAGLCNSRNWCFNLVTEEFEDEWNVINSVETDIEIMNAMSSILTTIMTSTQFLSMSRSGDVHASHQSALQQRLEDEAAITRAKMGVVKEVLSDRIPIYPTPFSSDSLMATAMDRTSKESDQSDEFKSAASKGIGATHRIPFNADDSLSDDESDEESESASLSQNNLPKGIIQGEPPTTILNQY